MRVLELMTLPWPSKLRCALGSCSGQLLLHSVAKLLQGIADPIQVRSLDLEDFVFEGAPRAADGFQAGQQLEMRIGDCGKPADGGNDFAVLAPFDLDFDGLLHRRNSFRFRRRAGAR